MLVLVVVVVAVVVFGGGGGGFVVVVVVLTLYLPVISTKHFSILMTKTCSKSVLLLDVFQVQIQSKHTFPPEFEFYLWSHTRIDAVSYSDKSVAYRRKCDLSQTFRK